MSNGKPKLHFLGLRSGWPLWAAAAATLAFGLVLLIWPGIATEWILNLCGAALLIAGAANIFRYYRRGDAYRAYNWDLSVGILLALAGLSGVPYLEVGIPGILSLYFDVFSGGVQALVFSLLTMVYIGNACPPPEPAGQ